MKKGCFIPQFLLNFDGPFSLVHTGPQSKKWTWSMVQSLYRDIGDLDLVQWNHPFVDHVIFMLAFNLIEW